MAEEVVKYFSNLFTSSAPLLPSIEAILKNVPSRVITFQNFRLIALFTTQDFIQSPKQFHPLKTPRPDGLLIYFYQKYSPQDGDMVTKKNLDILNNEDCTHDLNQTLLALMPKIKQRTKITQFRPVSLHNMVYKLISKTLANRLKTILNDVISVNQSTFIPRRLISNNAILRFEAMHKIKSQYNAKVGLYAFKVHMAKAYDKWNGFFFEKNDG